VRRTLTLVSGILLVETSLFTAMGPLLPHFADRYGLSKGETGVLVASYAGGAVLAAIPSGICASRVGVKLTALTGVGLMAAASVIFGLASDAPMLFAARLTQGIGAAFAWTGALAWLVGQAPRERRGELIGFALAAALGGAFLGPLVGIAANLVGTATVFVSAAGIVAFLFAWLSTMPTPPAVERQTLQFVLAAIRNHEFATGFWLIVLAGLLVGVLGVLAPLQLSNLGWGGAGIGAIFLIMAAGETLLNPILGRWSDKSGRLAPVRFGLVLSALLSAVLPWPAQKWTYAGVVLGAGIAFGFFWTPAMALLSDASEARGLGHAFGFALMNLAWAPGHLIGSASSGALAQVSSDAVPLLLASTLCLGTLFAIARFRRPSAGRPRRAGRPTTASTDHEAG
jgi:MFS family permease